MQQRLLADARPSRREFLAGSFGAAAAITTVRSGSAAAGFFTGGGETIRVGLIGCGGRGTGAAVQAAAADPAVRIVALGDLFADQVDSAAHVLSRDAGDQFAAPADRRFVGGDACLRVLDTEVDVVLLATPPHVRPAQMAAAARAGKHIYCEAPVAIDVPGVHAVADACALARSQGRSVVSGLCFRRDAFTTGMMQRIRDGIIGRPLEVHAHAAIGLPWRKPADGRWTKEQWRQRNWISWHDLSGGDFVEHHVHALDRAVWSLGDAAPVSAVSTAGAVGGGAVSVRYRFADGAAIHASCARAARMATSITELARGTDGTCDLLTGEMVGGHGSPRAFPPGAPGRGIGMYQAAMDALVRAVRSGQAVDDAGIMCRSTLVAIMGRMAAASGRPIFWADLVRRDRPVFPAPTMHSSVNVA
jgi:hypothetical protein